MSETVSHITRRKASEPAPASRFNIISNTPELLVFEIEAITINMANVLRRTVMEYVESIAFKGHPPTDSDIIIHVNTTPIVNEEIMERVGLIPIHVDTPTDFDPSQYEFRIDVTNTSKTDKRDVTAADFEVRQVNTNNWHQASEFFKPNKLTGDHVLLAVLPPAPLNDSYTQRLHLTATPSINSGIYHAGYIPGLITYEYVMDEDPIRIQDAFDKWIVVNKKDNMTKTAEGRAAAKAEFETLEKQRVYKKDSDGNPAVFKFTIESFGPIPAASIFTRALEVITARVAIYTTPELPENCTVSLCNTGLNGIDIVMKDETNTMGSLLQFYLANRYVKIDGIEDTKDLPLIFAGYVVPHPLEVAILLRLGIDGDDVPTAICIKVLTECAGVIKADLMQLESEWSVTLAK